MHSFDYRLNSNRRKILTKAFERMFIITLLFLLIYNPQLRIMSSGFTRYLFLFLVINLFGRDAIKRGIGSLVKNAGYIEEKSPEMRYACFGIRFIALIISYLVTTMFCSGLIEIIVGKGAQANYVVGLYIFFTAFIFFLLEYAGILKFSAFVFLAYARGIRFHFTKSSLFAGGLIIYWFCLTLFFTGVSLFQSTYDFTLPGLMMKVLLFIFPVAFLTVRYLQKKGTASFDELLCLLTFTIALQALFIILDWFVPLFSSLLQSVIQKNPMALRASGITGEAGDGLSLIQALGAITSFQLFMFSDLAKRNWLFGATFILQVLSIAFVGRTGFLLVIVFIATSLVLNRCRIVNFLRLTKLVLVLLVVCFSLYSLLIPPNIKTVMEERFLPWTFEFAYSLAEKGTLETSSTTDIKENMLFLPDNEKTILVGDGYYQDPANSQFNYMGTDSGYVRFIFYTGLIGSFMFYLYFLLMTVIMYKISNKWSKVAFIWSTMAMLFVAQIKFPFLIMAHTHIFLLLLFFCLLNEQATSKQVRLKQLKFMEMQC